MNLRFAQLKQVATVNRIIVGLGHKSSSEKALWVMYFISFQLFIKLGHHTQIKNAKHPRKGKHQKESVPWKTLSDGSQALKLISAQLITKSKTGAPDILRPYFERSEARKMPIVGKPRAITSFSKIKIGFRRLSPEQIPYRNITSS